MTFFTGSVLYADIKADREFCESVGGVYDYDSSFVRGTQSLCVIPHKGAFRMDWDLKPGCSFEAQEKCF